MFKRFKSQGGTYFHLAFLENDSSYLFSLLCHFGVLVLVLVPLTPRTFLLVAAAHRLQNNPMQSPEARIHCVGLALDQHDNASMSAYIVELLLHLWLLRLGLPGSMNAVKNSEAPSYQNKSVTGMVAASATTAQQCNARAS